ncbi:hypothetical protein Patl1_35610 [Pistacia atlantica]|nr:hypothetical protein Patl1_35610 [Pistacia atlantica]
MKDSPVYNNSSYSTSQQYGISTRTTPDSMLYNFNNKLDSIKKHPMLPAGLLLPCRVAVAVREEICCCRERRHLLLP